MAQIFEMDLRDSFYNRLVNYLLLYGDIGINEEEHVCEFNVPCNGVVYKSAEYDEDEDVLRIFGENTENGNVIPFSIYLISENDLHEIIDYFDENVF